MMRWEKFWKSSLLLLTKHWNKTLMLCIISSFGLALVDSSASHLLTCLLLKIFWPYLHCKTACSYYSAQNSFLGRRSWAWPVFHQSVDQEWQRNSDYCKSKSPKDCNPGSAPGTQREEGKCSQKVSVLLVMLENAQNRLQVTSKGDKKIFLVAILTRDSHI